MKDKGIVLTPTQRAVCRSIVKQLALIHGLNWMTRYHDIMEKAAASPAFSELHNGVTNIPMENAIYGYCIGLHLVISIEVEETHRPIGGG